MKSMILKILSGKVFISKILILLRNFWYFDSSKKLFLRTSISSTVKIDSGLFIWSTGFKPENIVKLFKNNNFTNVKYENFYDINIGMPYKQFIVIAEL